MTDAELCSLIDYERSQGIGIDDELSADRAKADAFYIGYATGVLAPPDVDGRSKVVSKQLMEVVEWAMPSLMRMFCAADDIIRFEPSCQGDEKVCKEATDYCAYILHRKNDGFTILHDAIKSALITRCGWVKVYCEHSWDVRESYYEGLSEIEIEALKANENLEIEEVEQVQEIQVPVVNGQPQGAMPQP